MRSLVAGLVVAAVSALTASVSHAVPVIELSPGRDFPIVTLGDTVFTPLGIANHGDVPLVVSAIDAPPGVMLVPAPPFTLVPESTLVIGVGFAPPDTASNQVDLTVRSNDPMNAALEVHWIVDVRALAVDTRPLTPPGSYPLGEAVVVQTDPAAGVHVEQATLFYRSQGAPRFDPLPMNWNGRAFIAIIPGSFVVEGGIELYVIAENSGFTVHDPPQGAGRPIRVDVDSPRQYQLNPVVRNPGFIWRAGESIDFLLQLSRGTVFQSGLLHYRRGGESSFAETAILENSFTGISASIPSAWVGPRGVEYWSEIQTLTRRLTEPENDPESEPHELRVTVESLAEETIHPAGRYRMLSIPLEMPSATGLSAILSDETAFGAYDPVRWRAFRYLPEQNANVELSQEQASHFTLAPGRAFWLISRGAHRADISPVPGVSTPVSSAFSIVLAPGWNQIGNPFAFPVSWSSVRLSQLVGDPVAFDSERNDYAVQSVTVLEPFEGYFVENASAQPETISIQPTALDSVVTVITASEGAAALSSLALEARGAGGVDLANRVGVAADARVERDARDQSKPPPAPGAPVRLAIANRDWSERPGLYRQDFRPADAEGNTWELEVSSLEPGVAVELTVRAEGVLPPGSSLRLLDREQGSVIELPANAKEWRQAILAFGSAKPYRLALLMGSDAYLNDAVAPNRPALLQFDPVAPNPARGPQRLRFGLPRAASVRLEVFDAAGRKVATLIDGQTMPPGFHAVLWRPERDGAGRPASGLYFHRLTAGGETRTVRSVLVR